MITENRRKQLRDWWNREDGQDDEWEWRDELTLEEAELVEEWDHKFNIGMETAVREITEAIGKTVTRILKENMR